MADNMKLELVLLGKDLLGKMLGKDITLLKNFRKEGEAAAKATEKINAAKKKLSSGSSLKGDTDTLKKRTSEMNKAAAAQEKLNNAIKREPKRGADGRLRDGRGRFAPGGRPSSGGGRRGGSFEEDLMQGGTGAGALWASKKGMGAAMTQQEALTDVYNSFYRSSLSAGEMNGQMEKAEEVSIRLGNKLKGNTADFANMLSVMKQNGMEATTILNGAGEAAAYLAVANREDYSEVGKNYAQFGQLFGVEGKEDNLKIADLMSRARGKGISSDDLITASKFFGGRTAKTMDLTGAKGAEEVLRFMTFIKQNTALDASSVGTGSSAFFRAFTKDELKKHPVIPEIEKKTGVKLDLFDEKGQFKGLENAVAKFAQLKGKLSDKESLQFGQELAGDEGAAVLSAMINAGSGYQKANQDLNQMASMMTKAAKESDNLSNKVEALTGSLENLGAAGFTPMLKPLGKLADETNNWVGSLTDLAKANPDAARTVTTIGTLGGAILALKGGSGMLSHFFGGATSGFKDAWNSADGFQKKIGALRNATASPISVSLQVMAAGMTIDHLLKVFEEVRDRANKLEENNKTLREQYDNLMGSGKLYNGSRETGQNRQELDSFADRVLETMKQGRALEYALQPERAGLFEHFWTAQRPYASKNSTKVGDRFWTPFSPDKAAGMWGKSDVTAGFRDPNVLARLLAKVESGAGMNLNDDSIKLFVSAIEKVAGKEKIQQAREIIKEENGRSKINTLTNTTPLAFNQLFNPLQQTFGQLKQPAGALGQDFFNLSGKTTPLGDTFTGLNTNAGNSSGAVQRLGDAAQSVANRLNNLQITPSFGQSSPSPSRGFFNQQSGLFSLPGRAKGGSVKKGNAYEVGEVGKELFVPNQSGSIVSNDVLRKRVSDSKTSIVHQNNTFHITGKNADEIADRVLEKMEVLSARVSRIESDTTPDRLAQRVEYAAQRDSERL